LAYTLALILLGAAPSVPLLAFALFLFGMAHGSMDVTMNVWATEVERAAARPLMASFHAMFSLGAGLGAGLGYFAIRAGIDVPTHFAAAGSALAVLSLYFASANWTSNRAASRGGSLFAFPKGLLALVGLIAFAAAMGEGAVADWGAVFLKSALGSTEAQATLGYTAFSLAIFATRMAGDRIIDRFGPARTARASGFAAMTGVLIVVASTDLWQALGGFALMGLGYAVLFPLAFSRAAADPAMTPGRAIASVATLGYGGLLLGPPLIGFLAEATSLRAALTVLALLAGMIVAFAPHLAAPEQNR
jgi:predicted MFS family arabinose efflux permease